MPGVLFAAPYPRSPAQAGGQEPGEKGGEIWILNINKENPVANAKSEFIEGTSGKQILCAKIRRGSKSGFYYIDNQVLRCGYTPAEFEAFLESLDFEYDSGYGAQELFGNIWYTDGTWSERNEYDGSEWWRHQTRPRIPEECGGSMEILLK